MNYKQFLATLWTIAIIALTFLWWKSIQAEGVAVYSSESTIFEVGILGGDAYLAMTSPSGATGWSASYDSNRGEEMHPDDEERYKRGISQFLGEFALSRTNPKLGHQRVFAALPFWFFILLVSGVLYLVFLILKRRARLKQTTAERSRATRYSSPVKI